MKAKLVTTIAGLLLLLVPAEAAFRDLLISYINSVSGVVTVLDKIKNENDAKVNSAALDAAITNMKTAKAQLAAGGTNAAEVGAAVKEKETDLQKATALLAEQTKRCARMQA